MQHLFITDPFEVLIPNHDSTLALMRSALEHEHQVLQCQMNDLYWNGCEVTARAKTIEKKQESLVVVNAEVKEINLSTSSLPIVWMRKDPPVDNTYIKVCQLLRLAKCTVLNNPNSLMACDEKLFALEFPELIPKTYIVQQKKHIVELVKEQKRLIAKPIGAKGGEGIFMFSHDDKNLGSLIEVMTQNGKSTIILQEYLPQIKEGDKRIFLLNGDPLGAVLRLPQEHDHRANMAAGGTTVKTTITPEEYRICEIIKPRMLELGMHIVGIDTIGNKLTEINITSPTCLEEINNFDATDPCGKIIRWAEQFAS
ncbi:glutathione synthase [Candidatus Uabimicrobium sp. HlEnr_7]|uniref:glutathione synthase n=1 Tax=Candidatus Uabimicrobium helgolandensis TaxID=3095367 RepID=UPI00355681FC